MAKIRTLPRIAGPSHRFFAGCLIMKDDSATPIDFVSAWLVQHEPTARTGYEGVEEGDLHVWSIAKDDAVFQLGIPATLLGDAGLLSERLMELEAHGWLDEPGEAEPRLILAPEAPLDGGPIL